MRKVCGVGINDMHGKWCCYKRDKNYSEYEHRVYTTWREMLNRAYKRNNGSVVCDRWKLFSNFVKDIRFIPGYRLFLRGLGTKSVFLDKDIKYYGNRVYDPNTVMFVTIQESTRDSNLRHPLQNAKRVERVNINNPLDVKVYESTMSVEKDGFYHSAVSLCCRGKRKSHKGYTWRYL